jgi:penicillin-binding protein 1A
MASFSRRHGREVALQALYGTEVGKRQPDELLTELLAREDTSEGRAFVRDLVFGTLENEGESDALIGPLLEGWTLDRLPTIDRIILRMSAFELRHRKETDPAVVINEAVELAKKFSTEDSGRYVNGVLAGPRTGMRRRSAKRGPGIGRVVGRVFKTLAVLLLFAVLLFVGVVAGIVASYSRNLPDINRMADYQPSRSTRVFSRNGIALANLYRENRVWLPIDRIPVRVRNAFIATEDAHFYQHHGIDFGGIARAAIADYRHQHLQGASTITQQLARKLFLTNEVSAARKIQEALLAMEIERYYTKDEILERYLNIMFFGAGAYGIEAAAHTYFGTDVNGLKLGQSAMLAGLLAAPSDYSPYVNMDHAKQRQRHVLERMVDAGFITRAQAEQAERAPLGLLKERPQGLQSYRYPYFTTYVTHLLEQQFGTQATFEGGLQVYTTLDPTMQDIAQDAVTWGIDRAKAEGIGAHQGALVAIKPSTGEILAMVGGATPFSLKNQFNRAWQAHRQPGSSFKAYVYTAEIDAGHPPTTIVEDTPVSYPMGDGTRWAPMDDDNRFLGAITLRYALAQSRNVVAVKLAQDIGIDRVVEYAHRMGVTAPLDPTLSLALGSSGVSPLDQAAGFATLANQGVHIPPSPIRLVRDSIGTPVLDNTFPQQNEVVSAGVAYVMTSMLESVIKEGTGYPNAEIGRPAAGKTGTTSSFRDAWFVGYTPDLVAAVWIGNDDYSRMNESYGGNIPARIWARFMKKALEKVKPRDFVLPVGEVHKVRLCGTGKDEVFLAGTEPQHTCGTPDDEPDPSTTTRRRHRLRAYDPAPLGPAVPLAAARGSAATLTAASMPRTPASVAPLTPPPDVVSDGQNFVRLDEPAGAPAAPTSAPVPPTKR